MILSTLAPFLLILGQWGMGPGPGTTSSTALATSSQVASSGASSVTAISTSTGISITAGDVIGVFCRNGQPATASYTVTSSVSDTFSSLTLATVPGASGSDQEFYSLNAVGGASVTFTCTANMTGTYSSIIAWKWHPPHAMALDTSIVTTRASPTGNYVTGSFTTAASGVIFVCGDAAFATTYSVGAIGSGTGTLINQSNAFCEGIVTTGSQSSITGTVNSTATGNWGGFALALK